MDLYDDQGRVSLTAMKRLLRSVVHEELAPHAKRLGKVEDCQADMHRAIGGNGYGMSEGLVGVVKDLQDRVQTVEKRIDRFKWTLIGASLGSGTLAGTVAAVVSQAVGG